MSKGKRRACLPTQVLDNREGRQLVLPPGYLMQFFRDEIRAIFTQARAGHAGRTAATAEPDASR